uniref:Uncharacterized protein n=1 Tax=Arundo donax TaxID=35708 RepID=A0A0A9H8R2_ARUDO
MVYKPSSCCQRHQRQLLGSAYFIT